MYYDGYHTAEVVFVDRKYKDGNTKWTLRLREIGQEIGRQVRTHHRSGDEVVVLREPLEKLIRASRQDNLCGVRVAEYFGGVLHFGWIVAAVRRVDPWFLVSYGFIYML
jgi:hypothetical protein